MSGSSKATAKLDKSTANRRSTSPVPVVKSVPAPKPVASSKSSKSAESEPFSSSHVSKATPMLPQSAPANLLRDVTNKQSKSSSQELKKRPLEPSSEKQPHKHDEIVPQVILSPNTKRTTRSTTGGESNEKPRLLNLVISCSTDSGKTIQNEVSIRDLYQQVNSVKVIGRDLSDINIGEDEAISER